MRYSIIINNFNGLIKSGTYDKFNTKNLKKIKNDFIKMNERFLTPFCNSFVIIDEMKFTCDEVLKF